MGIIDVKEVSFSFANGEGPKILDSVSFDADEYEFVSLVGPSGCGKSTLLRIIAGLIHPTSGSVSYMGSTISQPIRDISFVFQDFALLPWLTNVDNVSVGLSHTKMNEKEKEKVSIEMLKKLDLGGFEYAYPNVLSGGMKQRVGLARALISNPKVLLMDEPFSSLDELTARALRSEVIRILKDKAQSVSSVIMVSHNVEEAVELSDKIVIFSNKPTHVKAIKQISLGDNRNRHSKEFMKIVDETYSLLVG
ncbi:ABC transporter ATP-binding protein [Candidatus Parvarchaeota archaeon]|nr:ABC transporter ATP-binding protein [Candidatus Parvarchaeota archaeon]